ncbi:MAG: type II secretion system secretin GspD [Syntrophobacteraceae bacterium]|jgi:general secretion pathway protein D|nr:type II secretion system secretin GspD [Syntrophobacteraceae bacterium]
MRIDRVVCMVVMALLLAGCASAPPRKAPPDVSPFGKISYGPKDSGDQSQDMEKSVEIQPDSRRDKADRKKLLPPRPEGLGGQIKSGLLTATGQKILDEPPVPAGDRQKIILNFEKADVSEVTNQVFGEYLKLSYVLDPKLQGRISMYLDGEYSKEELLQMVTRVYEANEISVVPRGGAYYLQPAQRSSSSSLPIATPQLLKGDAAGVRPLIVMYRLRYMDAKQAINTIKFFLAPGRPVTSENTTNTLIFVENSDNARTILEVLKALDVNVLQEVNMEIVPLTSISPQDAVQSMEALMGKLELFKESAIRANYAFIPLPNYGGILCLAQNPDLLKTIKYWLNALDVQGEQTGEQIHVYFVQNGLARDIGDILNEVFGLRGGGGGARPEQQIVGALGSRGFGTRGGFGSSSFGGGGSSTGRSTLGSSSRGLGSSGLGSSTGSSFGSGLGSTGRTSSFGSTMGSTTGSTTGAAGTTGRTGVTGGRTGGGTFGTFGGAGGGEAPGYGLTGEAMVIPDEVNNALVIRANAVDYAKIKKTIDTLDILPRAVLIEVLILEVTLNKDLAYGLEWLFRSGDFKALFNSSTLNRPDFNPDALVGTGLRLFAGDVSSLAALVTAIADRTEVNVLSAPTLLATDNKEASITVGGREPVPTGTAIGEGTGGTTVSTISYEETGIILNVVPHINAGGLVRLEVEQTIRRTGQSVEVGAGNTAPRFTERNVKTTLLAQNGHTVVIGGIIEDNVQRDKDGIPFLQDIPIISPLFSVRSKQRDRTELLIAITPHVIDRRDSGATREFLDRLRQLKRTIDVERM